ncbi:MAG: hypothetical protein H0W84_06845 [Bacteroidetes bacterium]|nr:hypothetical protein [Bacteroidota bacterium]
MKKITKLTLAIGFLGSILLSSCKKYEDGPAISLLTKKSRMANEWVIEQAFNEKGTDATAYWQAANPLLSLKKDKSYSSTVFQGATLSGTWDFTNKNEDVVFSQTSPFANVITYKILRLKDKELWLRETDSTPAELHYKEK